MKIGIIGAMQVEVEALISQMEAPQRQTVSQRDFHSGRLCGQDVVVAQCGVGKVSAAMCAEAMILLYQPDLIVNVGVAGGLTDRLHIGDIAVAKDLVQYDVDTSAVGDPIGLVSTVNRIDFPCAEWAVRTIMEVVEALPDLTGRVVRIASGDQFNDNGAAKKLIVEHFGGEVCEMEGCPIAQVCYINGVDCAVIRAISDSTDGGHAMEYSQFCQLAARNSSRIMMGFLERLKNH